MSIRALYFRVVGILTILFCVSAVSLMAATPQKINYQGFLRSSGLPVNTTLTMVFDLYDAPAAGGLLCSSGAQSVTVSYGRFNYVIGSGGCDISTIDWQTNSVYLEITVDGNTMTPREQVLASAYSISNDRGTPDLVFIMDNDNVGAGASSSVAFNRGTDSANDATLTWDEANDRFLLTGDGSSPATVVMGTASATTYFGDGSNLTGISTGGVATTGDSMTGPLDISINDGYATSSISAYHVGTDGRAGYFVASNGGSGLEAVKVVSNTLAGGIYAYHTGNDGYAINANIDNAGAPQGAFSARTNGDGSAAEFYTTKVGNATPTVYIVQAGNGPIIEGATTGGADFIMMKDGAQYKFIVDNSGSIYASGSIVIPGYASATTYYGDGSNLTGISTGGVATTGDIMTGNLIINQAAATSSLHVIQNDNTFQAASFEIANAGNNQPIIVGSTTGTGHLAVLYTGAQPQFLVDNSGAIYASGAMVLESYASATTYYGDGSNLTGISGSDATKVLKTGDTMSGTLEISSGAATDALYVGNIGTGSAASLFSQWGTPTLYVENTGNTGTGSAAMFQTSGSANASNTIFVQQLGAGRAGMFRIDNVASTAQALRAQTSGNGAAVLGVTSGSGSAVAGIISSTTSPASSLYAENSSNSFDSALLSGDHTGADGELIRVKSSGQPQFIVNKSGDMFASGSLELVSYASATTYYGDGSNLTGISSGGVATTGDTMTGALLIRQGAATASISVYQSGADSAAYIENTNATNMQPTLDVTTAGLASAANFANTNASSASSTVNISTTTSANGIRVSNTGTGKAANFALNNVANTSSAMVVTNNSASPSSAVIEADHKGADGKILVLKANSVSKAYVDRSGNIYASGSVQVVSTGNGDAARFEVNNVGSASASMYLDTISSSGGNALYAVQSGNLGEAAIIKTTGGGNISTTLDVSSSGMGGVARFESSNAAVSSSTVFMTANGSGKTLRVTNSGTGIAGSYSTTNSTNSGSALYASSISSQTTSAVIEADHKGSAGNILALKANSISAAYVDRTGSLYASGSVIVDGFASATTYFGDGSNLTGISSGGVATTGDVMTGALEISQGGATASISVYQTGPTDPAGMFVLANGGSNEPVIEGSNNGLGSLILMRQAGVPRFVVDGAGNISASGSISLGSGGFVSTAGDAMTDGLFINAPGATAALSLIQTGAGEPTAYMRSDNPGNSQPIIYGDRVGSGHMVRFDYGGVPKFSVDMDGNIFSSGTMTLGSGGFVGSSGDVMTGGLFINEGGATAAMSLIQVGIGEPTAYIRSDNPGNSQPIIYGDRVGSGQMMRFDYGGVPKFSVDKSGNIYSSGTITLDGGGFVSSAGDAMTDGLFINAPGATAALSLIQVGIGEPTAYMRSDNPGNTQPIIYGDRVGSGQMMRFDYGGVPKFSVDKDGNIYSSGTITLDGGGFVSSAGDAMTDGLFINAPGATAALSLIQTGAGEPTSYMRSDNPGNTQPIIYGDRVGSGHMVRFDYGGVPKFSVDKDGNIYSSGTITLDGGGFVSSAGDAMTDGLFINAPGATAALSLIQTGAGEPTSYMRSDNPGNSQPIIYGDRVGSGQMMRFDYGGVPKFSVDKSGNIYSSGTITLDGGGFVSTAGDAMTDGLFISTPGATAALSLVQNGAAEPAMYIRTTVALNNQPLIYGDRASSNGDLLALFAVANPLMIVDGYGNLHASGSINTMAVNDNLFWGDHGGASGDLIYLMETGNPKFAVDKSGNIFASSSVDVDGGFVSGVTANGETAFYSIGGNADGIYINNPGTMGIPAQFIVTSGGNPNTVLTASTTSNARAAYFENSASTETLYLQQNGSGTLLGGNHVGGTGNLIKLEAAATPRFVVDISGNIYASGTLSLGSGGFVSASGDVMTGALEISQGATRSLYVSQSSPTMEAAFIEMNDPTNSVSAMSVYNNGTNNSSHGIYAANTSTGNGNAGYFEKTNAGSTNAALSAVTQGTSVSSYGLYAQTTGSGKAIYANTVGGGAAIAVYAYSGGSGEVIKAESAGSGPSVYGYTTGTGYAGKFEISNAVSGSNALFATTNGTGRAVDISVTNAGNVNSALYVSHIGAAEAVYGENSNGGAGKAGYFTNTNAANSSAALSGVTAGTSVTSYGVYGQADGNGVGVFGSQTSSGSAMYALNTGTGVAVYGQSSDNTVGKAGYFSNTNAANTEAALSGVTSGTAASSYGVFGQALGAGSAIYGQNSGAGYGVQGYNTSTGYAVYGLNSSNTTGVGGYFTNTNAANTAAALSGVTSGTSNTSYGVYGEAAGNGMGLYGINSGLGNGLKAENTGNTPGGSAAFFLNSNAANSAALLVGDHKGTGNLLQLQQNAVNKFVVDNTGVIITQGCPNGMTNAGNYCIDTNETAMTTWDGAASTCSVSSKQLCTPAQWYGACNAGLPLNNLTDNWEWVDGMFFSGSVQSMALGSGGCYTFTNNTLGTNFAYRCCYNK